MDSRPTTSLREAPRSAESWFESLPEEHRQRIVREDEAELERWEELGRQDRLAWRKPVLHAVLLLTSVSAFITAFSWVAILTGVLSGALIGWIWHKTDSGQIGSPLIAVPIFQLAMLVTGELNVFALIWAPMPIGIISLWLGMRRHELPGS